MTENERIAVLETEMRQIRLDVVEINISLKSLNAIAQRGGGALHTILMLGGVIGWLLGIGMAFYSIIRPHG